MSIHAEGNGPSIAKTNESPWYQTAFGKGYLELYSHRNLAEAETAVEMITDRLKLNPDHRLLDLCCGPGRHMIYLAQKVRRVVGLDLSEVLLGQARRYWGEFFEASQVDQPYAMLVRGTMNQLPFEADSFDRVVNLFTSFGYFENEDQNQAVMNEVGRVLVPGGMFVIDHINRATMLDTLQPKSERTLPDGRRLIETRLWDDHSQRVRNNVLCMNPDGSQRQWHESVRVYTPGQINLMLGRAGMRAVDHLGNYSGQSLDDGSSRMIIFARKG